MKHLKPKSLRLFFGLAIFFGLSQMVSAQLFPGYNTGPVTIGDSITMVNGDLINGATGEIFLGESSPRGFMINMLSITGSYTAMDSSRIYFSVNDNSNLFKTRGFVDIVGTATQTTGATQVMLDMFVTGSGWDGSCITLIRANRSGSDVAAFRMDAMPQQNGRVAILRYTEQDNDLVWYLAEQLITGQNTGAQSVCLGGSFSPLSVEATVPASRSYQWYRCNADGTNLVPLGSANGAQTAFFTPPAAAVGTSFYRCIVSNPSCETLGNSFNLDTTAVSGAMVVSNSIINIVNQPIGGQFPAGEVVTLSVTVDGGGASYQWFMNGAAMNGETGSSITVVTPSGEVADAYHVNVSSACGGITQSLTVTVGDIDNCLPILVQKRNHTLLVNNNPKPVVEGGNGGYSFIHYTWYRNDSEFLLAEHGHLKPGDFNKGGYFYTGGSNLNPLDSYYVSLIANDGKAYQTCPFNPTIKSLSNVTAYPIPLSAATSYVVTVDAELSDEAVLADATIDVYNAAGAYLSRTKATGRYTQVALPGIPGVYVLVFKSSELTKEIKIIVEP